MLQEQTPTVILDIVRMLLSSEDTVEFNETLDNCLKYLCEATKRNRIYIWQRNINDNGEVYWTQRCESFRNVPPQHRGIKSEKHAENTLMSLSNMIDKTYYIECFAADFTGREREILDADGIKSFIIAPINIKGLNWGLIGIDDCETGQPFSQDERYILQISGFLFANAIERMETLEKLHELDNRAQAMLNATPICCDLWDRDFHLIDCNDATMRFFRVPDRKTYMQNFYRLSPKYQPCGRISEELAREKVDEAFRTGYCHFKWMHQTLEGEQLPAEVTLVRIEYKDDYVVAGYTRDMSAHISMLEEIRHTEEQLRIARDEAMYSSRAKSNFLASMSHEIRTPMNAISGLADIIIRESHGQSATVYATEIKNACNTLLTIINDILDISKIESGKLDIVVSQYSLASLINDVLSISRMRLGKKPVKLIADIDPRLPAYLEGDEIRIKQILMNLMTNAIKFTAEGYIEFSVSTVPINDTVTLIFRVTDTGQGIRSEDMGVVFDEFSRVNTKRNRSIEGTGLGLPIAKKLCEMMNGRILVDSVYGKGSIFTVIIEQRIMDSSYIAAIETPKTILLYESDDRISASIDKSSRALGCSCTVCASRTDFFDHIKQNSHNYIFTSPTYIRKVKEILGGTRHGTQLVMLTHFGEIESISGVISIHYPITCLQIADIINNSGRIFGVDTRHEPDQYFKAPEAKVLIVDDNEVNLIVAKELMKPFMFRIDTVGSGYDAVDMVKANRYDLVFMDHMMPGMDGIDATVTIRKLDGEYFKNLPIVALTANAIVGTSEMFIREGMNDFLAKPIEKRRLFQVLDKWIPQEKRLPADISQEDAVTADFFIPDIDVSRGLLNVGGKIENYRHILGVYRSDGIKKHASVPAHFIRHELSALKTEIHALKSSSYIIGAEITGKKAEALENALTNGDIAYVNDNIEDFLITLNDTTDNINAFLNEAPRSIVANDGTSAEIQVSMTLLNDFLTRLLEALEYVRINDIETILSDMSECVWPEDIAQNIRHIKSAIAIFDYDEACAIVQRMKKGL